MAHLQFPGAMVLRVPLSAAKRILERAAKFYADVLGLSSLFADERLRAFAVGGKNVLLLFRRGASLATIAGIARPPPQMPCGR